MSVVVELEEMEARALAGQLDHSPDCVWSYETQYAPFRPETCTCGYFKHRLSAIAKLENVLIERRLVPLEGEQFYKNIENLWGKGVADISREYNEHLSECRHCAAGLSCKTRSAIFSRMLRAREY